MHFHDMTYMATTKHKTPCPEGHDIQNIGRPFLGHRIKPCSSTRTPVPGDIKFTNLVVPFLVIISILHLLAD